MYFTQRSLEKKYYFFWRGCVNLQKILGGICMDVKVIVFEKGGDVNLATLINPRGLVCRANFTNIVPCPKELLECVPAEIAGFCKDVAPMYLYFNEKEEWESAREPFSV